MAAVRQLAGERKGLGSGAQSARQANSARGRKAISSLSPPPPPPPPPPPLYNISVTGLRFFTVYGPWGRPDMAYFSMAHSIRHGEPIELYGHGTPRRSRREALAEAVSKPASL